MSKTLIHKQILEKNNVNHLSNRDFTFFVKNLAEHNKRWQRLLEEFVMADRILSRPNHRRKAACTRSCPTKKYTLGVI